jgi:hypothetical protein
LRLRWCFVVAAAPLLLEPAPGSAASGAAPPAPDTPTNDQLFPLGQKHFRRCWQLEHDYYALPGEIAHTGVIWRRQQLEQQWGEVRDQRRESCLKGW